MKTDEVCDRYLETFGRRYFWGYLRLILSVSWINTRKFYESVANSIARKGVQRVEEPLAGSRGSAPCASLIQTALCGQHTLNPIVDACRVSQRQSQRLIQRLQLVVVVFTVQHLQMQR